MKYKNVTYFEINSWKMNFRNIDILKYTFIS